MTFTRSPFSSRPMRTVVVASSAKPAAYKSAPTVTPTAPPGPSQSDAYTTMAVVGASTAAMSYILLKQLVKNGSNAKTKTNLPASHPLVKAMNVQTSAAEVSIRASKVDLFASPPSDVAAVRATVVDRMDRGDSVSYVIRLEDGAEVSALLTPEEDKRVWGVGSELGSLFGMQKTVYVRVKPLDIEPLTPSV